MPWIWIHIAAILFLGSLLFVRRSRPRDLHRAPPGQTALLSWTRLTAIGLVFLASLHVVSLLHIFGGPSPAIASDLTFWLMLGTIGFSLWSLLSENPHAAQNGERDGRGAKRRAESVR